tara:strand:+ start:755 stop:1096 length:342 start_codon:yes stop_codon:yes gene_type:complete
LGKKITPRQPKPARGKLPLASPLKKRKPSPSEGSETRRDFSSFLNPDFHDNITGGEAITDTLIARHRVRHLISETFGGGAYGVDRYNLDKRSVAHIWFLTVKTSDDLPKAVSE